nr:filamin-B [Biomphalaria glabrata]
MYTGDYETFAHQEEKHFSNYATVSSRNQSISRAFLSVNKSREGDNSTFHGDHSGGEDEDKYVFNFPGPGDLPMSPSSGSNSDYVNVKQVKAKQKEMYSGENAGAVSEIPYFVAYSSDGSIRSKGSQFEGDFPTSKSRQMMETSNAIISSSKSSINPNDWILPRVDLADNGAFVPQRSSTMVSKHSHSHKVQTVSSSLTKTAEAYIPNPSASMVPKTGYRPTTAKIIYETIPVSESSNAMKSFAKTPDTNPNLFNQKHLSTFDVSDSVNIDHSSKPTSMTTSPLLRHSNNKSLGNKGEYTINVKFADQEISGSPFTTKAFDMRKLVVSGMPSTATRNNPVQFNIDASQAGAGNIEIRVNEGRVPCTVENKGNHRFTASFLPENTRPHSVEICFNDTHVVGSPWTIVIVDHKAITLKGKEKLQCNKKASAFIHANGQTLSQDDLDITIKGPNGVAVPYDLSTDSTGDTVIKYLPIKAGEYNIHVKYCDHNVTGSPFIAKAYNIGAIYVTPLQDGFINQPMHFTIDVGEAGEGQLQIMVNQGNTPNDVEAEGTGHYKIKFIPTVPGKQVVDILFNEKPLPCSPLTCVAQDLSASLIGLHQLIPVHQSSSFTIQSQANIANLSTDIIITGPNGQIVPVAIARLPDGQGINVEYVPREMGIYTIRTEISGMPIKGSPFSVRTFDPNLVKLVKIKQGIVGVPCKFNVDASEAGDGTLEITVSHNGQNIPNNALAIGKNRYECSFIGHQPGTYKVNVLYNNLHVNGSPYNVNIVDVGGIRLLGDNWNLVSCNKKASFNLVSPSGSFEDMNVKIIAADGTTTPCRLSDNGDGTAKIDWHPTTIGTHRVFIDYAGVPIQGSPFNIKVYDASRVRVSNINPGVVNRPVSFTLDASEAGDGNLEILVMCDDEIIPNYVQDEGNTVFKVTFTPKRAGLHHIHTQFNGQAVKGSPQQCPVVDPENIQVSGKGVDMAAANMPTSFQVNMKHAGDARINVRVVSPYGEEIPVHVSGNAKSGLRIDYTPMEVGLYKVFIDCAGSPVKGSPFSCNVFDPALIRINAPGRAYFGKPMNFHLDTSAAGEGKLKFQVKCRGSDVPCRLREVGQDRFEVSFIPQNIAPHLVTVFFNDMQVPGTPFEVTVIDSTNISFTGEGMRLAKVYKEVGLQMEHQGLDERDLDIKIVAPSGNIVPARLNNSGNNLRINFTPLEVGAHKIQVGIGDTQVNGSPFTCNVYDPSAVRIIDVDKSHQKEREIGFTIDSSTAGTGALEVLVTHKGQPVRAECSKISEGQYHYTFKPLTVGRYEVKATFNGDTIPGSPLIIEVEEDAPTFIRIKFSSIEPINTKGKNWFMLQTSGRKVDKEMLDVMILAPTGENIPARLLQQPDGDYKVEWTPNKPGRHSVDVMYGGQQIQGSPFYIDVFDIHKIRVNNFFHGDVNEKAGFKLDCTHAGKSEHDIRIMSPSGRNVPYNIDEHTPLEYSVWYTPIESGQHKIFVSYGGMELNGNRCELGSVVFPGRESGATRTSKDTANKVLFSVNSEHTDARLG